VVRQFLNGQRQGPIGMAEEKDAGELAAEAEGGQDLPPIPPIPLQLSTSDGGTRSTQRPPGEWLREHAVVPPPGSFDGHDVDVPVGDGRSTGWNGTTPPEAARGHVEMQKASQGPSAPSSATAPPVDASSSTEPAQDEPARQQAPRPPLRSRVPAGGATDSEAGSSVLVADPPQDEAAAARPTRPTRRRNRREDA
jgi:hypothetical protein